MRLLTDDPVLAAEFVPDGGGLRPGRAADLPRFDAELARALGLDAGEGIEVTDGTAWTTLVVLSAASVSQFDALDAVIGAGTPLPGPVACVAMAGDRFHGQRGRSWAAARGNLHVSVAMPVRMDAAESGIGLSMLPAVAAVDAVSAATGGALVPGIKWVNDIVIGDRKAGGVLTAARVTGRIIENVLWGIGINVAVAPRIPPNPVVPATTCLAAHRGGESVSVPALFRALLGPIEYWTRRLAQSGTHELLQAYRSRCAVMGRAVQVWDEAACAAPDPSAWGPPFAEGVVAEIAADLSLRLEGQHEPVTRGRLALQAPQTAWS